jgi:RNA polymerase sigma-70 factor (ECF subfamily)
MAHARPVIGESRLVSPHDVRRSSIRGSLMTIVVILWRLCFEYWVMERGRGDAVAEVWTPAAGSAAGGVAGLQDFEEFYRAELPRLVALARALAGAEVADDLAQEAMLVAYRRWSALSRYRSPEAWVRRTCANLAVSAFRRRLVELRGLARLASRPQPAEVDEDTEAFWTAVRQLPTRQAQVAALRYVYGLTITEISQTLQISEGSVKVHLSRARSRLASTLGLEDQP